MFLSLEQSLEQYAHGTSVEIVEYDDKLYLLYIGAMKHDTPSNLAYQRTELEGLKIIKSQGNGITGGWYLSTHNSRFIGRSALAGIIPINGSMPDYTSGQIPWNMMIYKPHMTPVASWN